MLRTLLAAARAHRTQTGLASLCAASTAMVSAAFGQTPPPSENVKVVAKPRPSGLAKLPDTPAKTPESIDVITQTAIRQQAATAVTDALRYAPGITLNSGEGGAHGDNVNLRGFNAIDAFFLDGIRDPGAYTRDSFDIESLDVLQGPASILFGNGPAGGAINQLSKQATLTPIRVASVEGGTNDEARATLDIDQPITDTAAVRLNLMGETTGVTDRDYVQQRRWGAAPSLALGLGTPTTFTLDYFHESENNIPDYGVPFLFGQPAPVNPSLYYGLKNYDVTQTDVNIVTAALKHDFNDDISLSNTFRYANYWSNYRVSAPHFGDDFTGGAPAPGTPLDEIYVYRDRPSSEGVQTYLTDHTDLTAHVDTGPLSHTLITGFEIGRQTGDFERFDNEFEGIDGVAPTPLLSPNAEESAPQQNTVVSRPNSSADIFGAYVTDEIRFAPHWSLDTGLRFDRYTTVFGDGLTDVSFHRVDTGWTPKVALVFQPTDGQTYYASYTTSFDPAVSYLTLAPDSVGPPPQTAKNYELGAKVRWLGGSLLSTFAAFRIDSRHITVSDPDDPTLQEMPGTAQRVQGVELTTSGRIGSHIEINANYTFIDPEITASSIPAEIGKQIPNAARQTANLWLEYEPDEKWELAVGVNYVGHRYADNLNTANVPGYVVLNNMIGYQLTPKVHLQLNIQNLTGANYYTGAYYSDATENHVLPGQGRVFTLNTRVSF